MAAVTLSYLAYLPAVVDVSPDTGAFVGGVELGLSAVFLAIAALGGVALIRRLLA